MQNWPPQSLDLGLLDFHMWSYMRNMVYEHKVVTRDEVLQQIFDAAKYVNDATVLHKVTFSIIKQVRMDIQADGSHFEHLLN
jgi:hypothetical protein